MQQCQDLHSEAVFDLTQTTKANIDTVGVLSLLGAESVWKKTILPPNCESAECTLGKAQVYSLYQRENCSHVL